MNAPLVLGASGVPLEGFRLVRVVYLDESGQSSREPRIVQAGVIVHGDSSYRSVPKAVLDGASPSRPSAQFDVREEPELYMFDAIPRGDE